MNRYFTSSFILFFPLLLVAASSALATENKKPLVSVSMSPYDFFVKKIAGDLVDTFTLIPAQADHETYEPGLAKVSKIATSALFVCINPNSFNFEKNLEKYLKDLPNNKTILLDSSSNIKLTQGDPHIWTAPSKVKIISQNIFKALIEILPNQAQKLESNLNEFLKEIEIVSTDSSNALEKYQGKTFYSYHKSWSYFATDYQLNNGHIEFEGREPSLAQQIKLLEKIKSDKTNLIILENPEQGEKVKFLKGYLNFETVVINAQEFNWLENQKKLVQTLLKSFNQN